MKTKQITVPPETADFVEMNGSVRFGFCYCPFCQHQVNVVGRREGVTTIWASDQCRHSMGAVSGGSGIITVLFKGN